MNVLFVSGGNSKNFNIAPFIKAQGDSLQKKGVNILYYPVKGKGIWGYLKNAASIRKQVKQDKIDVIHAHYTLSGWVSVLSFSRRPIVLSLMGSDAYGEYIGVNKINFKSRYLILLTYLIQPFVASIICKSEHIKSFVYLKKKARVIPNGIIFENFKIFESDIKKELDLTANRKHVLFLGNPKDPRKNYKLLEDAIKILNDESISILAPYPITHDEVVKYLNAVDVLVAPSFMEGSSNLVKEAMACNCPVISTPVGDSEWLFGKEPGHYITFFSAKELAAKISDALTFKAQNGSTQGRQRLISLGLEDQVVAEKIISIYHRISNK